MYKKLTIAAMLAAVLFTLFTATAFAAPSTNFQTIVNQANERIDDEIDKAVCQVNAAMSSTNAKIAYTNQLLARRQISWNEANGRIMNYKADLGNMIQAIGSRLIATTDRIANEVIQEGRRRGITVVCTYVPVNLGGKIFLIDPLRIVGN